MRWMFGIVINRHTRAQLARHVTRRDAVQMMARRIAIMAGDPNGQTITGTEPNAIGADLDIELVNLVRRERFAPFVRVIGRPGFRTNGIDLPLQTAKPAAREQPLRSLGVD